MALESFTPGEFVFLAGAAVVFAAGLYGVARGLGLLRTAYAIRSSEPIPAAAVERADGVVEIEGDAKPAEETVSAAVTGTECLGYTWTEETKQRDRSDDRGRTYEWKIVDSGGELAPFYVADETGEIAVDPAGATPSLETDVRETDGGTRRTESRLEPDDRVHVYGRRQSVASARDGLPSAETVVGAGEGDELLVTQGGESDAVRSTAVRGLLATLLSGAVAYVFGKSLYLALGEASLL